MKTIVLLIGFWHFNSFSNEMQYWVSGPSIPSHTCGFVSRASDGMLVADVLALE